MLLFVNAVPWYVEFTFLFHIQMTGGKRVFESYRDISIEEEELGDVGGLTEEERKIRVCWFKIETTMFFHCQ